MSAFWALVLDTWRQSKQQSVFVIMVILLFLASATAVVLPKEMTDKNGKPAFGFLWSSQPVPFLASAWRQTYIHTLQIRDGTAKLPGAESRRNQAETEAEDAEMENRVDDLARQVPLQRRAFEMWAHFLSAVIFTIGMMFFIAACSGYFPDMLAAGAIDMVVSKPITRLQVFLGKFVGGLLLYSVAILGTYTLAFVGLGLRFGFWPVRLFLAGPMTVFAAALLYAILALIGILRRSPTLAIVVGYIFYVAVDTTVDGLIQIGRSGGFKDAEWLRTLLFTLQTWFPNFGLMKAVATGSVLTLPYLDWQPMITAAVWLVGALSIGYWRFRRADF